MGKFSPPSLGGALYVVSFLDDYSRYTTLKFIKSKSEVPRKFEQYRNLNENKHEAKMRVFKSDNGGEYMEKGFRESLKDHGIEHRRSCPRCPEQNGRAERLNRTLLNMTRCMLVESGAPKALWAEALNTACFVKNRCPTRALGGAIPLALWENREIRSKDLTGLKVFGCKVWTHAEGADKVEGTGEEGVFVGYDEETEYGIRVYSLRRGRIVVRSHGIFEENVFPFKLARERGQISHAPPATYYDWMPNPYSTAATNTAEDDNTSPCASCGDLNVKESATSSRDDDQTGDDSGAELGLNCPTPGVSEEDLPALAANNDDRETNVGDLIETIMNDAGQLTMNDVLALESDFSSDIGCIQEIPNLDVHPSCRSATETNDLREPRNVKEALIGPNKRDWLKAMGDEFRELHDQNVWELVPRPANVNVIGCKWVLKTKRKPDGTLDKFKARLVAMGCSQKFGVDYEETFSPVVRRETIRLMMAVTCEMGWSTRHVDVTSAYLNSPLPDTIFMHQPQYFTEKGKENYVCKLNKSLYGLKQSGKEWYETVDRMLCSIGLIQSKHDQCLYFAGNREVFITVYVDDFGVWGEEGQVMWFVNELSSVVKIRDLGEVSSLLNLNIRRINKHSIAIDQELEIENLLREHKMLDCNGHYTPLNVDIFEIVKCGGKGAERCDETLYRRTIGNLLYISNCTRPDLSFAVSFLAQFCNDPLQGHWSGVKHLMRYLKQTKDLCLTFSKSNRPMLSFCDSDFAQNKWDRKSFSGLIIQLANGTVIWSSRKQTSVSMSTVVAEYLSLSSAVPEVLWLTELLNEMGFSNLAPKPATILMDNSGAICVAKNRSIARKTKCIDVRHHFLRDEFRKGNVTFTHVRSSDNIADIMTKSLPPVKTKGFLRSMGLISKKGE